jgi:hypothetical protein
MTEQKLSPLAVVFRDSMDWGRSYGLRLNLSPETVDEVAEQFADKALQAIAANTPAVPDLIAGALFDFAGFLTTRDKPVEFGASCDASPAVELLQQFAKKRGLSLESPDIQQWSLALAASPQPQPVAPLTPAQRRLLIDEAGNKTDGLNQDDFADEIVLAVERHHGITKKGG